MSRGILQISHSKFTVWVFCFCFSQWQMTNTFKQTHRTLIAISQCESSGELSVSMVLTHTIGPACKRSTSYNVRVSSETLIRQRHINISWVSRSHLGSLIILLLSKFGCWENRSLSNFELPPWANYTCIGCWNVGSCRILALMNLNWRTKISYHLFGRVWHNVQEG